MSCSCSGPVDETELDFDLDQDDDDESPWWRDREVMVPVASGVALASGWAADLAGAEAVSLGLYWIGLLLGASTFVPGALRRLVTAGSGRLGIALLMTISAAGAVILGYVGEAAALAFLYSIAEALEDKAMDRARNGLRALLRLVPETAAVLDGGVTREIPARELVTGQVMLVRPGDRVATDGVVHSGRSSLDTSVITGESIPVEVGVGDEVLAGSINSAGVLEVEVTAAGTDNSLTTIVRLVQAAQTRKGERARIADRIAKPLVPGVLVVALLVAVIGSLLGDSGVWITRALVVLVAASPCAIAIAVPITVVSGVGAASTFGVVVTSGAAFERLGAVRHLAVDKTGTLTRGRPTATSVISAPGVGEGDVLRWAAALERVSTHPLASAIVQAADEAGELVAPVAAPSTESASTCGCGDGCTSGTPNGCDDGWTPGTGNGCDDGCSAGAACGCDDGCGEAVTAAGSCGAEEASAPVSTGAGDGIVEEAGHGIRGRVEGGEVRVGSPRWVEAGVLADEVAMLEEQGMTVVVVQRDGGVAGIIGVRDELRPEVSEVVRTLSEKGIGVTMLTGDNERTARALAAQAGITDVRAALRPEEKASAVTELGARSTTAMIGDGINDAPALAASDVGIAMGAHGSDAAIESADIAFTGHDLRLIPQALDHAQRGRRIIDQNIALSLLIIAVLPPLAITGVLGLAAVVLVHEVAEVIVILNGLRAARTRPAVLPPLGGDNTRDAVRELVAEST